MTGIHLFSNLSAVKSAEAAKMEIADFLIIEVSECDGNNVALLLLSVPACSHLFHELHLCNFLLELCFLISSLCVYIHAKRSGDIIAFAVLQFHNVSICLTHGEQIEHLQVALGGMNRYVHNFRAFVNVCLGMCMFLSRLVVMCASQTD